MKRNTKRKLKNLRKAKPKQIGWFEKRALVRIGKKNGKIGLPREGADGKWNSPFIAKELKIYEELIARLLGEYQTNNEESFAKINVLLDRLEENKKTLEGLDAVSYERKNGESKMSDKQIVARRLSERGRLTGPLKKQIADDTRELIDLIHKVEEERNTIAMICQRVKERTMARLTVYWEAAFTYHTDNSRMPVVPDVKFVDETETVFNNQHKDTFERFAKLGLGNGGDSDVTIQEKE